MHRKWNRYLAVMMAGFMAVSNAGVMHAGEEASGVETPADSASKKKKGGEDGTDQGKDSPDQGQSGADRGQPAADQGQSGADQGQPASDQGQSGADQSQPASDQGQPAADQNQPAAEQNQPAADQGQPAADQGQPAAEQGQPAADQNQGGADQGQPAADQGQPAADQGQGGADQGQPAAEQNQPAADQGQPAADQGQPAADQGQPAADQSQPAAEQNQPAADQSQPAADQGQPAADPGQGSADQGQSGADQYQGGEAAADQGQSSAGGETAVDRSQGGAEQGQSGADQGQSSAEAGQAQEASPDAGEKAAEPEAEAAASDSGKEKADEKAASEKKTSDKKAAGDKKEDKKKVSAGAAGGAKGAGETSVGEAEEDVPAASALNAAADGTVSKTVTVEWDDEDDNDSVRPGSLVVYLVAKKEGAEDEIVSTVTLSAKENWSATVDGLPTEDEAGNPISYSWVWEIEEGQDMEELPEDLRDLIESGIPGYDKPEDIVSAEDDNEETVRRYTHKSAQRVNTIQIVWEDEEDANGYRPDQVTLTLPSGETVTVYAKDGWAAKITLPFYKDGKIAVYEWQEESLTGYEFSLMEIDGGKYTIHNQWKTKKKTETEIRTVTKEVTETELVEVPVEKKTYTLTVQYWNDTTQAFDTYTAVYEEGQKYNVVSPALTGYSVSKTKVTGTIKSDTLVNVRYTPRNYTVKITYRFSDGTEASEQYVESIQTGTDFTVDSPDIDGYTASEETISGTVSGRNLSYVVYYTRDEEPETQPETQRQTQQQTEAQQVQQQTEAPAPAQTAQTAQAAAPARASETLVEITDYETPLGLGGIIINAGDCFE